MNDTSDDKSSNEKVSLAISAFCERHGIAQSIAVEVLSELPLGKGMASSTAEIGSAVAVVATLMQIEISAKEIAEIALRIEPTDGVLFDEIVLFDHVAGSRLETIGSPPPIEIIVLEPDETVDTIAFNKVKQVGRIDETAVDEAIEMAKEGINSFDLKLIGQAAMLSARLNQRLLFKPELEDIIELTKRRGALGVNVAHSGSVIGILVESGFAKKLLDKISHFIPKSWDAYVVSMIGGGVRHE
jgi:L-threonine kinase